MNGLCDFEPSGEGFIRCRHCRFRRRWDAAGHLPKRRCRPEGPPAAAVEADCPTGCGGRKAAQNKPLPSLPRRAANFAGAELRDVANRRRRRTPEQIARLFAAHCDVCPEYNRAAGACSKCGCPVSAAETDGHLNKLARQAESCPLEEPKWPWPAIAKRNLLFYLLPLRHSLKIWQWHVAQLRRFLPLFNGRKIVTIATAGEGNKLAIESAELVRAEFGTDAEQIEFFERPNDPNLWETAAWTEMLGMVASSAADEATFYFHAKGVRRANQAAIRPWREEIYKHNLERSDEALESLRYWSACGIALRNQDPTNLGASTGGWHFAGTGFWFRHDRLFGRPGWEQIQPHTHAVEAYLATRFPRDEVHCLAHENMGDVYSPAAWSAAIARESAAPAEELGPAEVRASVIVTARNYGHWLADCLESCLGQQHAPLEIIYCDDGSTDDSVEVFRRWALAVRDPASAEQAAWSSTGSLLGRSRGVNLRLLPLGENLGVAEARNRAAAKAVGNALLFVDADNLLPRNYLSQMVAALDYATPFVYGDLAFFGAETAYHRQPEWRAADLWQGNHVDTCSLIWREAFELAGGWIAGDWCSMEDWHLFLRLSCFGAGRRANVALGYRKHAASLTAACGRDATPGAMAACAALVRADVERWAIETFGRLPSRAERDIGVTAAAPRELRSTG